MGFWCFEKLKMCHQDLTTNRRLPLLLHNVERCDGGPFKLLSSIVFSLHSQIFAAFLTKLCIILGSDHLLCHNQAARADMAICTSCLLPSEVCFCLLGWLFPEGRSKYRGPIEETVTKLLARGVYQCIHVCELIKWTVDIFLVLLSYYHFYMYLIVYVAKPYWKAGNAVGQ